MDGLLVRICGVRAHLEAARWNRHHYWAVLAILRNGCTSRPLRLSGFAPLRRKVNWGFRDRHRDPRFLFALRSALREQPRIVEHLLDTRRGGQTPWSRPRCDQFGADPLRSARRFLSSQRVDRLDRAVGIVREFGHLHIAQVRLIGNLGVVIEEVPFVADFHD